VGWMLDPQQSGGGALRNLGIHGADAFLMLTGGEPYSVKGAALHNRIHHRAVEEFGSILLESDSGVIATVEAGYSYASRQAGGDFEWRIALSDRYLIDRDSTVSSVGFGDSAPEILPNRPQGERYREFGRDTLERLAAGSPPIADLEDCYNAMLLVDRAYEKAGLQGMAP